MCFHFVRPPTPRVYNDSVPADRSAMCNMSKLNVSKLKLDHSKHITTMHTTLHVHPINPIGRVISSRFFLQALRRATVVRWELPADPRWLGRWRLRQWRRGRRRRRRGRRLRGRRGGEGSGGEGGGEGGGDSGGDGVGGGGVGGSGSGGVGDSGAGGGGDSGAGGGGDGEGGGGEDEGGGS